MPTEQTADALIVIALGLAGVFVPLHRLVGAIITRNHAASAAHAFVEIDRWINLIIPIQAFGRNHALFLKGSRRVGKTELAKKLGNEEYRSYLLIDFRYAPKEVKDLFSDSMENLDFLFTQLQSFYGVVLYPGESLVILDEIQLCIEARQDITRFVSDGRYDYCETGSLAGIHRNSKEIVTPVGEYPLEVHPLDFEEFLWAIGDHVSMALSPLERDFLAGEGEGE